MVDRGVHVKVREPVHKPKQNEEVKPEKPKSKYRYTRSVDFYLWKR